MGRTPEKKKLSFKDGSGVIKTMNVETFTWEKLDYVAKVKKAFKLK
jgi:S-adenosylmethionine synthetase